MDPARHVRTRSLPGACLRRRLLADNSGGGCRLLPDPARPDQVRAITFHASEARGLGWARAHAQSLWDGEEFVLQIDSHMRFADDWDARMIAALEEPCRVPDPVLTVYPPGYTPRIDGIRLAPAPCRSSKASYRTACWISPAVTGSAGRRGRGAHADVRLGGRFHLRRRADHPRRAGRTPKSTSTVKSLIWRCACGHPASICSPRMNR